MSAYHPMRVGLPLRPTRQANFFDSGIYEPPPASPSRLSPANRAIWDDAYENAYAAYTEGNDTLPNVEDIAKRSAWRTLDAIRAPEQEPRRVPTEASCIVLGRLLEYSFVDMNGHLHIRTMQEPDPPELLWDHQRKLLYCFPQIRPTHCSQIPPNMKAVADLYERWAQRPPHCYNDLEIPAYKVHAVGLADTVSYRSDKWNDESDAVGLGDATPYIHDLGRDVWCWMDADNPPRQPKAIVIGGGRLDMHEKGLIH
jgi:hypothetical protein